jgi:hypothetical protein
MKRNAPGLAVLPRGSAFKPPSPNSRTSKLIQKSKSFAIMMITVVGEPALVILVMVGVSMIQMIIVSIELIMMIAVIVIVICNINDSRSNGRSISSSSSAA